MLKPFYVIIAYMKDGTKKYFCMDNGSGGYGYTSKYVQIFFDDSFYKSYKDNLNCGYLDDIDYLELKEIDMMEDEMI